MNDHIDLQGLSGASYRFRACPEGAWLPRTGGNYLYVRRDAEGVTVVRIAETDDLSQARDGWPGARRKGATHLYTRLNVSGQIRAAEHRDLSASHRRARAAVAAPRMGNDPRCADAHAP